MQGEDSAIELFCGPDSNMYGASGFPMCVPSTAAAILAAEALARRNTLRTYMYAIREIYVDCDRGVFAFCLCRACSYDTCI